jgi:hypothetical protein
MPTKSKARLFIEAVVSGEYRYSEPVENLCAALKERGIDCSVEHPGYVSINRPGEEIGIGTQDGFWGISIMDEEGADIGSHMDTSIFDNLVQELPPEQVPTEQLADTIVELLRTMTPWSTLSKRYTDGDNS